MPQLLTPHYYSAFRCVGADCPEHCCRGWTIALDKTTYNRYLDHSAPEIGGVTREHVKKVKKSTQHWAEAALDEHSNCRFLDGQGLCNVHKLAGPEMLSTTCTTYPRTEVQFADQIKRSLKLSCPEACRLILFDHGAMQLSAEAYTGRAASQVVTDKLLTLQGAFVELLTRGGASAEQVLFFAGMMVHKAETLDEAALVQFCGQTLALAAEPGPVFGQLPYLPRVHWLALAQLIKPFEAMRTERSQRGSSVIGECVEWLHQLFDGEFDEAHVDTLYNSYFTHVKPFFDAHLQLLAHYLFYQVLDDNFPAAPKADHVGRYQLLVADFFMLRTLLTARAALKGGLSEADVVAVFYSYHARRQHNARFRQAVAGLLGSAKLAQDVAMYALLVTPAPPAAGQAGAPQPA